MAHTWRFEEMKIGNRVFRHLVNANEYRGAGMQLDDDETPAQVAGKILAALDPADRLRALAGVPEVRGLVDLLQRISEADPYDATDIIDEEADAALAPWLEAMPRG